MSTHICTPFCDHPAVPAPVAPPAYQPPAPTPVQERTSDVAKPTVSYAPTDHSKGLSTDNIQIIVCMDTGSQMGDKHKFGSRKLPRMEYALEKVKPLFQELLGGDLDGVDTLFFADKVKHQRIKTANEIQNVLEFVQTTGHSDIAAVLDEAWSLHDKQYTQNNPAHKMTIAVVLTGANPSNNAWTKSAETALKEKVEEIAGRVFQDSVPQFRVVFAPIAASSKSATLLGKLDNPKGNQKDIVSQINVEGKFDRDTIIVKATVG